MVGFPPKGSVVTASEKAIVVSRRIQRGQRPTSERRRPSIKSVVMAVVVMTRVTAAKLVVPKGLGNVPNDRSPRLDQRGKCL